MPWLEWERKLCATQRTNIQLGETPLGHIWQITFFSQISTYFPISLLSVYFVFTTTLVPLNGEQQGEIKKDITPKRQKRLLL